MSSLPYRTTIDDAIAICGYLAKKPTGASTEEAKKVVNAKLLDFRKIVAYKLWGLAVEQEGRLKITDRGRLVAKGDPTRANAFRDSVREVPAYAAVLERVAHRSEDSLSASEVAAHWFEHFSDSASGNEQILNDQAVCFFQLAQGAGLGQIVIGRKGQPTRFNFIETAVSAFVDAESEDPSNDDVPDEEHHAEPQPKNGGTVPQAAVPEPITTQSLGQGIFIAHGKNKKPLEQLRRILDQFKVPYKVATEEPNLGRPIGTKVKEVMEACNCAILIFTADEEFLDKAGNSVWRPSENVVHELGASSYLYGNRIVIMKEESVVLASNYKDLGYISFEKDSLDAKTMDVLKELIGFGIVKIST